MNAGSGYVSAVQQVIAIFEILEQTVEKVGATDFTGQAFYDAAVQHQMTGLMWEGYPQWSFTETKRYLADDAAMYKYSTEAQDLVRLSDWLPLVMD